MDWTKLKQHASVQIGKYKYVLLVLVIGIVLMTIPSQEEHTGQQPHTPERVEMNLEEKLEEILAKIDGVGKVQVLLTEASQEETVYQSDEDISGDGSIRKETVIISDGTRAEHGLIRTVTPPTYLGAIIVCQGADSTRVQLSVVQAVAGVTGIGTDRIIVLKMK